MPNGKYSYKTVIFEIIMLLCSLVIVIPLLVVIFGSLKTSALAAQFNFLPPSEWHFENYVEAFTRGHLGTALRNSVIVTVAVVGVESLICSLGSFIISRRKSDKTCRFLSDFFSLGLIVPISYLPTILLLQKMHLNNTKIGLIFVLIATNIPWGMFLMTNFVGTIPKELDEAAFVDGATSFQLYSRVILPLLKPVLMTNIIIVGMGAWNDLQSPLYLLNSSKNITMPLTVYNFKGMYFSEWNLIFADLVLVALPMVLVFILCQKYIVSGITAGAVKG